MTSDELRQKYLKFFEKKGHKIIPSASLVPEHDPSVLFTTAGMHPLVPYLLGQPHPAGKRLVNYQKCLRTDDIDEVGDAIHHTFFEMLGNWSLGDYWKQEAIAYSYEFLTKELQLEPERIYVTCFGGDKDAPKDIESAEIWKSLGIPDERIYFYGKKENWWGPVGETGPCGPDTEIFYELPSQPCSPNCQPSCNCGHFSEIWNDVFMQYNKTAEGKFEPLKQKNVDTGMGLERVLAVAQGLDDDYQTELFLPAIQKIEELSNLKYTDHLKEFRINADHLRAAVFIIADGVAPSNKERGYVLRRLIRRAALQLKRLDITDLKKAGLEIAEVFIQIMGPVYPELENNHTSIIQIIEVEINKFNQTLDRGLKEFNKLPEINGKIAFDLFQTYGFPLELTEELAAEKGFKIDPEEFRKEFEKHRELSRKLSAGMFKGGLGEQSEVTTKYHTATHLLHAALRQILGEHVQQKGSNITTERLRFDFSHPEKLTEEQLKQVENLVNQKIKENLPVSDEEMDKEDALKCGALGFFTEKYGDRVRVYSISDFSKEICGGPHIKNTGELGAFKIIKEESAGAGIRRIYAILSHD